MKQISLAIARLSPVLCKNFPPGNRRGAASEPPQTGEVKASCMSKLNAVYSAVNQDNIRDAASNLVFAQGNTATFGGALLLPADLLHTNASGGDDQSNWGRGVIRFPIMLGSRELHSPAGRDASRSYITGYGHAFSDTGMLVTNTFDDAALHRRYVEYDSCGRSNPVLNRNWPRPPTSESTDKRSHYYSWRGAGDDGAGNGTVAFLAADRAARANGNSSAGLVWQLDHSGYVMRSMRRAARRGSTVFIHIPNTILNSYHTGGISIVLTDGVCVQFRCERYPSSQPSKLYSRDDGLTIGNY
ncbi:MAG: hypothetical protein U0744_03045 [Gemmataceae bacterium]